MTASEAYKRLVSEGCSPNSLFVHNRGDANDAIGLTRNGKTWKVYYTERGCDSEPIFTSTDESEAAEFFYNQISNQTHWHNVGFFEVEKKAKALETILQSIDVEPIRNDIPSYKFDGDKRFRVFVAGADIFPTRSKIGDERLTDESDILNTESESENLKRVNASTTQAKPYSLQSLLGFTMIAIALILTALVYYGAEENNQFLDKGVKCNATVIRKSENIRLKASDSSYTLYILFNNPNAMNNEAVIHNTEGIPNIGKMNIVTANVFVNNSQYNSIKPGDRVEIIALLDEQPIQAKLAEGIAAADYSGGYILAILFAIVGAILVFIGFRKNRSKSDFN